MPVPFEESRTRQNVMRSFLQEKADCLRYEAAAAAARREGLHALERLLSETAGQENTHARLFRGLLVCASPDSVPAEINRPAENWGALPQALRALAAGDDDEGNRLYPEYARIAEEEGHPVHARLWRLTAQVEREQAALLSRTAGQLEKGRLFAKWFSVFWRCGNCGFLHWGKTAPVHCPLCRYGRGWFQRVIS